ncbi:MULTISPECIES: hypothetical protein [Aerosakkonema]|uniref:hypothetical protein n=1 Tax=Aerosakkonema TaxID=1246629 RepID=UPI0035BA1D16
MPLQQEWQDFGNQVSKLIARTWLDSAFQESFISDPKGILESVGLLIPEGVEVQVEESSEPGWRISPSPDLTNAVYTICLPPKPTEVTDEEISSWINLGFPQSVRNSCC